ncbi:MAG: VOC family protein, partial [Streptosporangiaceae bacterium]
PGTSGRVIISFRLPTRDAVDDTYERLTTAGHRGQRPPYDAFWGPRYAVVQDPDGNLVGLMSPASAAHRRPPPQLPRPKGGTDAVGG